MNDIILSIDTSSNYFGIGLSDKNGVIDFKNVDQKNIHDKMIASQFRNILLVNNLEINDLSTVSIVSGPGSFTGLRVGLSFVKGICFDNNPKLISVSSTENLAFQLKNKGKNISVLIKSHAEFYYYQTFDEYLNKLNECELLNISDFDLSQLENNLIITDNPNINSNLMLNDVRHLIEISRYKYNIADFNDPSSLKANYIQNFVPKNKKVQ